MAEMALLASALVVFGYALFARRLADGIVTGPMIFLGLGLAMDQMGFVKLGQAEEALHVLAEITLVVVLFSDAAMLNLRALRRRLAWPERMLIGGLPLAMLFGFVVGMILLPEWPYWEVALLAAILAPTDAAHKGVEILKSLDGALAVGCFVSDNNGSSVVLQSGSCNF